MIFTTYEEITSWKRFENVAAVLTQQWKRHLNSFQF